MAKPKVKNDIFDTIKEAVKLVFEEMQVTTKEDLKYLPSKDEYFEREDKMMGKLEKIEEELTILSDHSSDHSDRIESLEKIHPNHTHSNL
jgi:hypothetical protein